MSSITRRDFLGTSGGAAAGLAAVGTLSGMLRQAKAAEANEKFTIALIGCGGMGRYKLGNFMDTQQCNVAMLCDVDPANIDLAAKMVSEKLGTQAKGTKEFREVLDNKAIDLVIVATPDHWHAIPMIEACQAKKDVYVEKPCCHNVREGRAMVDAAKKHGRIVQVGTHQRSMPHIQEARELVRSGGMGVISMTNTYTYGNEAPNGLGHDPDSDPPAGVDYDRWLGPAPVRPFNKRRWHSSWRWYFDYGCGMVGDWNVHLQDIVMWTMGVKGPVAVSTSGGHLVLTDDRDTPDVMQSVYEFAGVEKVAPKGFVQTYTMRKTSGKPWSAGGYGMDFHGTNGYLHLTRNEAKLEADRENWDKGDSPFRTEGFKKNADGADQAAHLNHVKNFLECIKSRRQPIANIESHYNSVAACHLANVSLRAGRKIFWDAATETCYRDAEHKHEDKEANAFLTREYRKGYELPKI